MADASSLPQQFFSQFVQIGAVVQDLDQSIAMLTKVFGIGPFRTIYWPPKGRDMEPIYQGRPANFKARMAFAELGPIELELIQPLEGESIWSDFLAVHGPGIHHIRFNVPDIEPVIDYLAGQGVGVTQMASGIRQGTRWVNFDTEPQVGFTVEIMQVVPGTDGRTPQIVDEQVLE